MTLSRTARFLIAALLVAAAAFVWVNFFNQDPLSTQADSGTPVALAGDPADVTAGWNGAAQAGAPTRTAGPEAAAAPVAGECVASSTTEGAASATSGAADQSAGATAEDGAAVVAGENGDAIGVAGAAETP